MTRTGIVLETGRVSVPNSGEPALQVVTDHRPECDAAFYLRPDSPVPEAGEPITHGDIHADYVVAGRLVRARKLCFSSSGRSVDGRLERVQFRMCDHVV